MATDPKAFIEAIASSAKASAAQSGIPASFTIAEGALESSWGTSKLAVSGKNLFGVKADKSWKGDIVSINTREFSNGQWVMEQALWRKYPDWQGCMDDHATFLKSNKRYAACFTATTVEGFISEIAKAGYATDPDYAGKILRIIKFQSLKDFDK